MPQIKPKISSNKLIFWDMFFLENAKNISEQAKDFKVG